MPVGVDADMFRSGIAPRTPHSILFLGRIASSKRPDVLVEALGILRGRGIEFSASLWGPTLPGDEMYRTSLMRKVGELNLTSKVSFREGVPHGETPALYASHEIFVNLSMSGMYDKTLFEAAACGCLVVSASKDFAKLFEPRFTFEGGPESLAACLSGVLELSSEEKDAARRTLRDIAGENSLRALGERLAEEIV
jgi:glycosyltransferase involved in cell wall biosynthesis